MFLEQYNLTLAVLNPLYSDVITFAKWCNKSNNKLDVLILKVSTKYYRLIARMVQRTESEIFNYRAVQQKCFNLNDTYGGLTTIIQRLTFTDMIKSFLCCGYIVDIINVLSNKKKIIKNKENNLNETIVFHFISF